MKSSHTLALWASLATTLSTLAAQQPANSSEPIWTWAAWGGGVAASGLHVSAAAGHTEILVAAQPDGLQYGAHWKLLRFDPTTQRYQQAFVSPPLPRFDSVSELAVGELLPNPGPEIVCARADGTLEIWGQAQRTRLTTFSTGSGAILSLALGDVDGIGGVEIVVGKVLSTTAYDVAGAQLWSAAEGASQLALGPMDGDPALEIATNRGVVLDGAAGMRQWRYPFAAGFGDVITSGDLDNDGLHELVGATNTSLQMFDVDQQRRTWSRPGGGYRAVTLGDADGDGRLEILLGTDPIGDVVALDPITLAEDWRITNPNETVTEVTFGDVDDDGAVEAVWGTNGFSGGLRVGNGPSNRVEWTSTVNRGDLHAPRFGDFDADGVGELFAASTFGETTQGGVLMMFDGASGRLLHTAPSPSNRFGYGCTAIQVAELDGQPGPECVVGSGREIALFDYDRVAGFRLLWNLPTAGSLGAREIELIDVDGDGSEDLVLGTDGHLEIWDLTTRALRWRSPMLGRIVDLAIHDLDGNGSLDLVGVSDSGVVYAFDAITFAAVATFRPSAPLERYLSLLAVPGSASIVIGDNVGKLTLFYRQGRSFAPLGPVLAAGGPIESILSVPRTPWLILGWPGHAQINEGPVPSWVSAGYAGAGQPGVTLHPTRPELYMNSESRLLGFRPSF